MPRLVCRTGPNQGAVYDLVGGEFTVGRGVDCDIQIPSEIISRVHVRLVAGEDGWTLADQGSRNGTFLNGRRVSETLLRPGDEILVGETSMVYVEEEEEETSRPALSDASGKLTVSEEVDAEVLSERARRRIAEAAAKGDPAGKRLLALLDYSTAANRVRSMGELFGSLAEVVEADLQPHRVVPILVEGKELRPWMKSKSAFAKALSRIPISQTIVNYVIEKRVAVVSAEAPQDSRFRKARSIYEQKIATAMCAPMQIGRELLGVIYADRLGDAAPFEAEDLELLNALASYTAVAVANVRSMESIGRERQLREKELRGKYDIVGRSPAIREVFNFIGKAAPAESSVLILGESGAGKELVARAIHANSPRKRHPFEAVNCAALAPSLLESELFGHVRGAFTGADADRAGRFELADGGVLFLDEIGELPKSSQSKLLRVLEQGEVRRLGDVKDRNVDVRLIAATNKRLDDEMREGRFREDLYFRLNVLKILLPPLRDRREDIPLLAEHFLREFIESCGRQPMAFDPETLDIFQQYGWPGNVRELRNAIERMVVMSEGKTLNPADIPYEVRGGQPPRAAPPAEAWTPQPLRDVEKNHIACALDHTGGNKKEAARILGIDRSTLYAKLKAYGLTD